MQSRPKMTPSSATDSCHRGTRDVTHPTDSCNVRKTAKPPRGDGRARPILSVTVPAELKAALERETAARKLPTLSAGVEQVLAEALAGAAGSRREDVMVAQLRRLNLRLSKLEKDVRARDTLIVELLTTLTRAFLGHTPAAGRGRPRGVEAVGGGAVRPPDGGRATPAGAGRGGAGTGAGPARRARTAARGGSRSARTNGTARTGIAGGITDGPGVRKTKNYRL